MQCAYGECMMAGNPATAIAHISNRHGRLVESNAMCDDHRESVGPILVANGCTIVWEYLTFDALLDGFERDLDGS